MKNASIVGLRSFKSKSGKDCNIVYYTYKDENDSVCVGSKTGQCFVDDDLIKPFGDKSIIGKKLALKDFKPDGSDKWTSIPVSIS